MTDPPPLVPRDPSPPTYRTFATLVNAGATVLGMPQYAVTVPTSPTPRVPHAKPQTPAVCADLVGRPNVLDLKLVEDAGLRLDETTGAIVVDGDPLPPAQQAELSSLNQRALPLEPGFDLDPTGYPAEQAEVELALGVEVADLRLWLTSVAGPTYHDDVGIDPVACADFATLLNDLNALSIVELAEPAGDGEGGGLPTLPPPKDAAPLGDTYGDANWALLDHPETVPELVWSLATDDLQRAYQGAHAGIAVVEAHRGPGHEKFNRTSLGGTNCNRNATRESRHAVMVQSLAYGSHRDLLVDTNGQYGMRGGAPRSPGGVRATCRAWGNLKNRPRATKHASDQLDRGDVVNLSQIRNGGVLLSSHRERDSVQHVTGRGRMVFMCAGNDGAWLSGFFGGSNDWGAALVAHTADGTVGIAGESVSGPGVRFSADGGDVRLAEPANAYTSASGCSMATPQLSAVGATVSSLFQRVFDRSPTPEQVFRAIELGSTVSLAPDFGTRPMTARTARRVTLATRLHPGAFAVTGGGWQAEAPNQQTVAVVGGPDTGISYVPAAGASPASWRSERDDTEGLVATEDEYAHGPLDVTAEFGFTLTAWVRITRATDRFQVLVSKEDPANYGLWIGPDWHTSEGRLSFAYDPNGPLVQCALDGTTRVDDGAWHHVAARYRRACTSGCGATLSLWVDGVRDTAETVACSNASPVHQGGDGEDMLWIARHLAASSEIARVTIHQRALADHELLELASEDPGVL